MQKLLIVIPSYRPGGDTTALYNLLRRIDRKEFEFSLFPVLDEGPYKERFENCTLLKGSFLLEAMLRRMHFSLHPKDLLAFLIKSLNRLSGNHFSSVVYRIVGRRLVRKAKYDAVIAWTEFEPTTFVSHIPHSKK